MATITYAYQPLDIVYHVDQMYGVREASIVNVLAVVTSTETKLEYKVSFTSSGQSTAHISEDDLFAAVDDALAEYKLRFLTPTP